MTDNPDTTVNVEGAVTNNNNENKKKRKADDEGESSDEIVSGNDDSKPNEATVGSNDNNNKRRNKRKSKAEARKEKKAKKQRNKAVQQNKGSKQDYFEVFGYDAKPSIELKLHEYFKGDKTRLNLKDVQELILWVLADGVNPKWVFVKNKPLIEKVVVVCLNSLDLGTYSKHSDCLYNLSTKGSHGCPTAAPNTRHGGKAPSNFLNSFLYRPIDRQAQKKRAKGSHETSALRYGNSVSGIVQRYMLNKDTNKNNNAGSNDNVSDSSVEQSSASVADQTEQQEIAAKNASETSGVNQQKPLTYESFLLSHTEMVDNNYPIAGSKETAEGYVMAKSAQGGNYRRLVAVDCEMCFTHVGLELTRVTLVDEDMTVIYDSFVMPPNPIINYNTRYSGITEKHLEGVTTTLEKVQQDILELISSETILVGHSLENDLRTLKLVHNRVIDTALLYPHPSGPPYKSSLRFLAKKYLGKDIQSQTDGKEGHDSTEDAGTAIELIKKKLENGPDFGVQTIETESIFVVLDQHKKRCVLLDSPDILKRHAVASASAIPCYNDDETLEKGKKEVAKKEQEFVWIHFHDLERFYEQNELTEDNEGTFTEKQRDVLKKLDQRVSELYDAAHANTMFIYVTGQGNMAAVKRLQAERYDHLRQGKEWTQEREQQLQEKLEDARNTISFFTIKH